MLVLVCGSRYWDDKKKIAERLSDIRPRSAMFVEGGAPGADTLAGEWAKTNGRPLVVVPANWEYYGRAAGHIRNSWMLDLKPDLVLAFHENMEESRGTKNCVAEARKRGIPVELIC